MCFTHKQVTFLRVSTLIFMCVTVFPAHMSVHHVCAWRWMRPEESVRSSETGYRWLWVPTWVLGTKPRSPEEHQCLQPLNNFSSPWILFKTKKKKNKDTSRKLKPREGVGRRRIFKKTNRYLDPYKTLKMTSAHEWKVPEMVNINMAFKELWFLIS